MRNNSSLLELENFITYELTTTTADAAGRRTDKSVYLCTECLHQGFTNKIHANQIALGTALNVFTSSIVLKGQL